MENMPKECHIDVANVCAVVAPTSSMVGSIQVAGRCVETAIYKLNELGFDTRKIHAAMGSAQIPPVRGPKMAMGVTNDATIYYGRITLTMNAPEIKDYLDGSRATSQRATENRSTRYSRNRLRFYKIDTSLFSQAEVVINETSEGVVYHVGAVNADVVLKSFGLMK